jgi:hypothetical protein
VGWNGGTQTFGAGAAGRPQTIGGLANGTTYTFTVRAENAKGLSDASNSISGTQFGNPGPPRNVTLNAAKNGSGALSLDWAAPIDNGGRPIQKYEWAFREGGGASGSTTATSDRASGSNGATYRYDVRACNARGCGPWESSNRATPTAPPPTVSLSKGATLGYYNGQYGYCGGTCWHYDVTVNNFPDGSTTGKAYCNGTELNTVIRINVSGGRGSYSGRFPDSWCGHDNAYVIIGGVRSNTW